jgi:putative redox protein
MKATARRSNGSLEHQVSVRDHRLTCDELQKLGGSDSGPSPQELLAASLASCTAITMEMYAQRKGWDIGDIEVDVDYEPAQRGSLTRFVIDVRMPHDVPEERRQRLMQIGAKCPIHRTLEGEAMFDEKVTLK